MLQETPERVIRACQRPDKAKLDFETQISKAERQYCHFFQPNKLTTARELKPSIRKENPEELQRVRPNLHSSLIDTRNIASAKRRL